jgi:hypothetical protein
MEAWAWAIMGDDSQIWACHGRGKVRLAYGNGKEYVGSTFIFNMTGQQPVIVKEYRITDSARTI